MSFGSKLKKLRLEKNYTQQELGNLINVSKANISKYESDMLEVNFETLKKVSSLFNVSIDYLLDNINDTSNRNEKENIENDIEKEFQELFSRIESEKDLLWDGKPLDDTTREVLKSTLRNAKEIALSLQKKRQSK